MAGTGIDVTVLSGPSPKTAAVISANQIFARVSVHTGLSCTLICIYLAGLSFPLRGAHTLEPILQVNASSTMRTWTGSTVIQIGTGWTIPAWRTLAFKPCWNLVACTTICTRTGNTGVLSYLTVLSREALWTGTVVLIWLGVHTGSSVNTRLMATAVIQIFIAHQTTPVLLAAALPGGVASPVDTTRMELTFITKLALPAISALAFAWDTA